MSSHGATVSTALLERVSRWLKQAALSGASLDEVVEGFCERLSASGLPLVRIHLSFSMLHPLYDALGFTWHRGQGISMERFRKSPDPAKMDHFLRSPYYYLLSNNLEFLRRRIDPDVPSEFPIFDDLKPLGATDYIAFLQPFGSEVDRGMLGSWSTDAVGGFTDEVIEALFKVQNSLAVAAKMAVLDKLADNMLTTYLGGNAGRRVMSGQIRRGDGETIRAALVMADMRDSTNIADREGRQAYIDTLNDFFDAIATPFNRNGGEIVSFIGDGFIAVYPCGRHKEPSQKAAQAAMKAVRQAMLRMEELNAARKADGLREIRFGIGLHMGNVMFGNVGLNDRLTFSAFGSAVNEVQRLQTLTKKYELQVIASQEFANYCGGDWAKLGDETLRGLSQKVTVLQPGKGNVALTKAEALEWDKRDGRSEAEQVMLLYRNTKNSKPKGFREKMLQ
ncbi:adenylate/guanylate cyclase domain-containing protein [Rhizobiaceae bacterium n13]|uniref:Adenylate/guanylate cyclase domain-containing protein n=1 Tax=Ferirhizobium litorale TaxID=2927786 RepID=A0AAE3QBW8_9HYPH|nr:adenylate/guanylate cyclase domain-containing protein [Fererhizobium litorale]MDI7861667.1 adenylate/guanylate cyclase domain-containing protein [Fererhizobium litorale]MDI7921991.1 adenylate/guanylate cyclase domain-containing protein [Fererhizobium litorale]